MHTNRPPTSWCPSKWQAMVGWRGLFLVSTAVVFGFLTFPLSKTSFAIGNRASQEFWSVDGQLLHVSTNERGERCMWRSLSEISPLIQQSFVAIEDRRFRHHGGVDLVAAGRAAWTGRTGASTLTMQLARLMRPHARTFVGKLAEAWLAMRIEATFSKDAILEQYLNRVPLGRNVVGVEAASWAYFGHSSQTLTLSEAAMLVALAPAPTRLDARFDRAAAIAARNAVLSRLSSIATQAEIDSARATRFVPTALPSLAHVVVGMVPANASGRVHLTLGSRTQAVVERVLRHHRQRLAALNVDSAAVVVVDNSTGDVRAVVPGYGWVNCATARRQAGSILKPFLYALRLEDGASPETRVGDFLRAFREGESLFVPEDNDGEYRGLVSLRIALASSLNVPAVNTLEEIGLERFRRLLERLGISLKDNVNEYGLGMALGVADVRLLDVTSAFAVFGRNGTWSSPRLIQGESLPLQVLAPTTARAIARILEDEDARTTGFGELGRLDLSFPVALKTGTSTDARDFWALAVTGRHTVGVWAGNADGRAAANTFAAAVATPILVDVVRELATTNPLQ